MICPCAGPGPGLLFERGVMEMEEGWAGPGTDTKDGGGGPVVGRPGRLIVAGLFLSFSSEYLISDFSTRSSVLTPRCFAVICLFRLEGFEA